MSFRRIVSLACAAVCLMGMGVAAAEVDCDAVYCFTDQDFSQQEQVSGICITGLPDPKTGTVMLGSRVLRAGDILAADQLEKMTFLPLRTETDVIATVTYLPIYENRVAPAATVTVAVRGKTDEPPVAEDSAVETYKNIPNEGKLKASDPEGEELTFTVTRGPKRGSVEIRSDGSFTYTPKKNKVGVDSFVFTATDPAGNVSRQATVTVQILKSTESRQYADTAGLSCQFEAQWLRNTGLFAGENVGGQDCFFPDKTVSRGDFLAMVTKALDIPLKDSDFAGVPENVPLWLKPYVGAAIRSGLLEGLPEDWQTDGPITGAEVAVMLQNALDLPVAAEVDEALPAWAADSVATMAVSGVALEAEGHLTRARAAEVLYQVSILSLTAPGMQILR